MQVLNAVVDYYTKENANPHRGVYELAMRATDAHEGARHTVAQFFNAEDNEIVFTQNTTESLNLIAYSYGMNFLHEGDEIVISVAEHHSNMVPWQRVAKATGAKLVYMYPGENGRLTTEELDKKIKRTPTDHPGYNEYQYHLDPIEHDPWQLTSFLTTLYDDYTRSEVQAKLQEIFKKQYKLTTWVEVQIRYKTVWVISPAGIPVPTQVPYEYKIFHTKLENKGLETVIRKELDDDQWKRYKIFSGNAGRQTVPVQRRLTARWFGWLRGVRHRLHGSCRSPNRQRICRNLRGSQKVCRHSLCLGRQFPRNRVRLLRLRLLGLQSGWL